MTNTKKNKKTFLFNPNNPKKSFDVYIDKNPKDTISIKYSTIKDVKDTIQKLEKLYKEGKYSHKRIWQVAMIMKVRLEAIKRHQNTLYPNAKNVTKRYKIAEKYYECLKKRTIQNRKNNKTKKMRKKYKGGRVQQNVNEDNMEDDEENEDIINFTRNLINVVEICLAFKEQEEYEEDRSSSVCNELSYGRIGYLDQNIGIIQMLSERTKRNILRSVEDVCYAFLDRKFEQLGYPRRNRDIGLYYNESVRNMINKIQDNFRVVRINTRGGKNKYKGGQDPDYDGETTKEDDSTEDLNISNISFDTFMSTDTPNSFLMGLNQGPQTSQSTEDSLRFNDVSDTSIVSQGFRPENPHAHYLEMGYELDLSSDDDENENNSQSGGKRYKRSHIKTQKRR